MPSPLPTYDDGLVKLSQEILHPLAAHPMAVTFNVSIDSQPSDYVVQTNAFRDIFVGAFQNSLDTSSTIGTLTAIYGQGDDDPVKVQSTDAPEAGNGISNSEPVGIACVIRQRTAHIGRRGHTRFYLPCVLDESHVDEGGNIGTSRLTALQTACDGFLGALDSPGAQLVVGIRFKLGNPTPPPADYVASYGIGAPVISVGPDPKVGYQRRRTGR